MSFTVTSASNNSPSASSSVTFNLPASIQANDLLLLFLAIQDNGRISTNKPTGFSLLGSVQSTTGGGEGGWFWKKATGSEGATASVTLSGSTTGGNIALKIAAAGWNQASTPAIASTNGLDPPSLSPSWGAATTLWIAALGFRYTTQPTVTFPTNYTSSNVASGNAYANAGWRTNAAASEDPATFATSGGSGLSEDVWTIGVQPAFEALFRPPSLSGLGAGGPFFQNPLAAPAFMAPRASYERRKSGLYVPERLAA